LENDEHQGYIVGACGGRVRAFRHAGGRVEALQRGAGDVRRTVMEVSLENDKCDAGACWSQLEPRA
jgi:hypothetical protein